MRIKRMLVVLPYPLLRDLPHLQIPPLGCVTQQYRCPRMINDYTYSGVNPRTIKASLPEDMQWGRTFHKILWYIYKSNQRQGTVLFSKTDISDGFYQIPMTPTGALKLDFPFPNLPGEPKLLAIPTKILMGWTEYTPAF